MAVDRTESSGGQIQWYRVNDRGISFNWPVIFASVENLLRREANNRVVIGEKKEFRFGDGDDIFS